jgi:hypothetical protein
MRFKLYEEFLNESTEKYIPQELALITVRYLYKNCSDYVIGREQYLSQEKRQAISREWGKRLPKGFPGPEKGMVIGEIIAPALLEKPTWRDVPYFDDADLVFNSTTSGYSPTVYRCKVENRSITSTWKDLGDWLIDNMATKENLLDLWLESDLSLTDFKEKYRSRIAGNKFGLS